MPKGRGKTKPRKPRKPKPPKPPEVIGGAAPEEPSVNGVLVQFEPGADGDRDLSVTALGDVKQTELPTVLGLARRAVEKQLGIGGG